MFCSILVFRVRDMLSSRLISDIYTSFQMGACVLGSPFKGFVTEVRN